MLTHLDSYIGLCDDVPH